MIGARLMPNMACPAATHRFEYRANRPMYGKPSGEHGRSPAAQHAASALCVIAIGGPRKVDDPGGEPWIETRTNVERAAGIQQPAQSEPNRAWRCERREMAGHDHAGVAERATVAAGGVALDQRDFVAALTRDSAQHNPTAPAPQISACIMRRRRGAASGFPSGRDRSGRGAT